MSDRKESGVKRELVESHEMKRNPQNEKIFFKKTKQMVMDSDIEYGNAKTFQTMQGEGPA